MKLSELIKDELAKFQSPLTIVPTMPADKLTPLAVSQDANYDPSTAQARALPPTQTTVAPRNGGKAKKETTESAAESHHAKYVVAPREDCRAFGLGTLAEIDFFRALARYRDDRSTMNAELVDLAWLAVKRDDNTDIRKS